MRCRSYLRYLVPAIVLLSFLSSARVEATLLYSQPYVFKTNQNGPISDAGFSATGQYVADNFILSTNGSVTSVNWYGYWGTSTNVSSNSMSFNIRFYTDSANKPNTLITNQSVMASGTLVGAISSATTNGMYSLTANLPSPVSLSGNTTYWISIYDNLNNGVPYFAWATAPSGLDYYAFSSDLTTWGSQQTDTNYGRQYLAFSLNGPAVPEPGTWVAAALLVGAAGYVRWRRRAKVS